MNPSSSARIARSSDHDRWLCALFAEPQARESIFSLLAFNAEVAKIRETVSEPILGDIRLKWWHETLEKLFRGNHCDHPVAQDLAAPILRYDLPAPLFDDIIRGRSMDMSDAPPATIPDLERYAELTGGAFQALISRILGSDMHQGRALGTAWALLGVLRAIPFHYSHGLVLLPGALFAREGLSRSSFLAPDNRKKLAGIVEEIAVTLEKRLSKLSHIQDFRQTEKSLFILARMYLLKLQRHGYDLHGMDWEIPSWKRASRLWLANMTGR